MTEKEPVTQDELDKLIQERIEEKKEEIKKEAKQELRQEIQKQNNKEKHKNSRKPEEKKRKNDEEGVSRRDFMKTLGLGTAGAAGLAMTSNAAGLNLSEDRIESVTGEIEVDDGDVNMQGNQIDGENGKINFGAGNLDIIAYSGSDFVIYDDDIDYIIRAKQEGDVEIPNGDLKVGHNALEGEEAEFTLEDQSGNTGLKLSNGDLLIDDENNNNLFKLQNNGDFKIEKGLLGNVKLNDIGGKLNDYAIVEEKNKTGSWAQPLAATTYLIVAPYESDRWDGSRGKIWGMGEYRQTLGKIEWQAKNGSSNWAHGFWIQYNLHSDRNHPPKIERKVVEYNGNDHMAIEIGPAGSDWHRWQEVYAEGATTGDFSEEDLILIESSEVSNVRNWKEIEDYSQFTRASMGGKEGFTIEDGNFGIGTNAPDHGLELSGNQFTSSAFIQTRSSDDSRPGTKRFQKSRGTIEEPEILDENDRIGAIQFDGYDGSEYQRGAAITSNIEGSVDEGEMPMNLEFRTRAQGESTHNTRMVLTDEGNLQLNEGQAIQDDNENDRLLVRSWDTHMRAPDGSAGISVEDTRTRIRADEDRNIIFRDLESSSFNALEYKSSSIAPGTLELTNADLDMQDNDVKKARSFSKSLDGNEVYKEEILEAFSESRDTMDEVFTVNASTWDAARISFYMPRADDANEMYVRLNDVTSVYRTTLLEGGNTITEEEGDRWFILRNMADRPYMGSFVVTLANEAIGRPQISREQLGARTRYSDDAHLINGSQGGGGSSALSGGDEDIRIWTDNDLVIKGYVEGLRWST